MEGQAGADISYGDNVSQWISDFRDWQRKNRTKSFGMMVGDILEEREIKPSAFYKKAWIDRRIYWNMMNLPGYRPSKETAVACAIGLELDENETQRLLNAAGYLLSPSITWDSVVLYCITRNCYDLFTINELLSEVGERGLGVY